MSHGWPLAGIIQLLSSANQFMMEKMMEKRGSALPRRNRGHLKVAGPPGSMEFLPVDAFRVNPPDLFGDVVGLPVLIDGALATRKLEVIVNDRITTD